ncbi:hypothetical protein AC249_AIPGENE1419 [Exaiptasia diaphana]|nr:hypothetical protein AC249_AIPGENE1419 [Exaiptasia diaphana]
MPCLCLKLVEKQLGIFGHGGCRDLEYLKCNSNKSFTGYVIKFLNVSAPGLDRCQTQCFREGLCVSYNLGPVNDGHNRTCELSSSDHWTFPDALKDMEGHEYCPIKNRCSSKPCPSNKFCYPDFAWDSFTCRDGHLSQWGPWSCTCPARRTRRCVTAENKEANDCGPGETSETDQCVTPRQTPNCVLFDFESGRLDGWTLTGTAFKYQPTYGDNVMARGSGKANMKGDWFIATYDKRPSPSDPPGGRQGDGPTGSATSPPFAIMGTKLKFLISGNDAPKNSRMELLIEGRVVKTMSPDGTGNSMKEMEVDVSSFRNQIAQLRIVDDSSGGWGFINVDHIQSVE